MSCVATQRTPCPRQPQAARSLSSYAYAQSMLERMYGALAITHLYRLVEAEGGKHNSVKDDEQEEGKETIDGGNAINNPEMTQRYQLSNNIESATLELDDNAQIISYEEYYPYGDTSYQAGTNASEVSQKRYRYTGKEKDEESGFYYMLARYYSGWLGRWTAADPAGLVDGVNLYMYCRGNPVGAMDPKGTNSDKTDVGFKSHEGSVEDLVTHLSGGGTFEFEGKKYRLSFEGELSVETVDGVSTITGKNLYAHEVLADDNVDIDGIDSQPMEFEAIDVKPEDGSIYDFVESTPIDNTRVAQIPGETNNGDGFGKKVLLGDFWLQH